MASSRTVSGPEGAEEERAAPGTPLYVHLPFCAAKCHYCDFFSVAGEGHDLDGMAEAILWEARQRAARRPRTVFLGGGTPSYLSPEQLHGFLSRLQEITDYQSSASEVTVECNPESLTLEKARVLVDHGATRLSIGFQSLRPEVLRLFGRVHDVEQSFSAFEAAIQAGVRSVNIDLIYAAPGQTVDAWSADLARVLALRPQHLSAYNLTFEEETPFQTWLERGEIEPLSEELELALFSATRSLTSGAGLPAYEISNYAASEHRSLHNLNYWRNGPYVGVGPSAVSKVGHVRSGNARSIVLYRQAIAQEQRPLAWTEHPSDEIRLAETWWLGLRLAEGVDPKAARERAGWPDDREDFAERQAEELLDQGFLERTASGCLRLSPRGEPVADAIARRFLSAAQALPARSAAEVASRPTR